MANIGLVNLMVSTQLKDAYFNNNLIAETKQSATELLNVVKESPILQLEFKVFDSIERKHIDNENLAMRYVDENVKLFEVYTIEEIEAEHNKLDSFLNESVELDKNRAKLYESIFTLIRESLLDKEDINVDNIHESFNHVLSHVMKPKKEEIVDFAENLNEEVIEIAVSKFNEKYKEMSLEETELFNKLVKSDDDGKKELFEQFKNENLELLNSLNESNTSAKIRKSVDKLNEMSFNAESANDDIINLFELKKGLS